MTSPLQQLIGCSVGDVSFCTDGDDVVAHLPMATVAVKSNEAGALVAHTMAVLAPTPASLSDAVDAAIHQRCASTTAASHGSLSVHYEPRLRHITVTAVASGTEAEEVAAACDTAASTAMHTRAWPEEILAIIEQRNRPGAHVAAPAPAAVPAQTQATVPQANAWPEPDPEDLHPSPTNPTISDNGAAGAPSAVVDPAWSDPTPTDPAVSDPAPSDAAWSDPTPSDAAWSDPATPATPAAPAAPAIADAASTPPPAMTGDTPSTPAPTASVAPAPPPPPASDPLLLPREPAPDPYAGLTDSANTRAKRARRLLRRRGERTSTEVGDPTREPRQALHFVVADRDLTTGEADDSTVVDLTVVDDVPDLGHIDGKTL